MYSTPLDATCEKECKTLWHFILPLSDHMQISMLTGNNLLLSHPNCHFKGLCALSTLHTQKKLSAFLHHSLAENQCHPAFRYSSHISSHFYISFYLNGKSHLHTRDGIQDGKNFVPLKFLRNHIPFSHELLAVFFFSSLEFGVHFFPPPKT